MWPNLAYTPSQLAPIPGGLLPGALHVSHSSGLWEFITLGRTAASAVYNSKCFFLLMPTPQASSLSSVLCIKKKLADYFSWIFCSVAFLPDFFTFSVLKERKEHESVRIVSKKTEAREGASSPGKAKKSQKDTIALFGGEQQEKATPTGGKFGMYG